MPRSAFVFSLPCLPASFSPFFLPMTTTSCPALRNASYGFLNSESSNPSASTHAILMDGLPHRSRHDPYRVHREQLVDGDQAHVVVDTLLQGIDPLALAGRLVEHQMRLGRDDDVGSGVELPQRSHLAALARCAAGQSAAQRLLDGDERDVVE